MSDIAIGAKVFMRTEKVRQLLESIEYTPIKRVYLADGGVMTADKEELYNRDFPFELDIIDLKYDAGLGKGRKEIVDRLKNERYLLIVDSDNEVPENVTILADQLSARPDIGGIAGCLVEPEKGRMFQNAKDFTEKGDVLVRSADLEEKTIEDVAGHPFVEFEFIPNVALFRTECLQDYCWDPHYRIGKEHIDFYVGHWKQTNWKFGICPEVLFYHYPGGDSIYEAHRNSEEKNRRSDEYFNQKWGYRAVRTDQSYWFDTARTERNTLIRRARNHYQREGLASLMKKSMIDGPRIIRNTIDMKGEKLDIRNGNGD